MMSSRISQLASHLSTPGLLSGQVAIVTGAGQGIGAQVARLFAAEGAAVVVADIDAAKAQDVASAITSAGGTATACHGDILSPTHHSELIRAASSLTPSGKIHILVNNAGYTWDGVLHKLSDAQTAAMLAVHLTAPMQLIRALAPYFRVTDGEPRCIVNISSTSGIHGNAGQANYAMAKAGMVGLTKTVAKEWGPKFGVRCNVVAFGRVDTRLTRDKAGGEYVVGPAGEKIALGIPKKAGEEKFEDTPLRRAASPDEAAKSILAVASPLFSYVTGQTIMVTGGRNM